MYAVTDPVGRDPSHMGRQFGSFGMQLLTTQPAIEMQAGSFGQLVGVAQQFVATQVAHDDELRKISLAPVHVPPSPAVLLSLGPPPPSPCAEEPPAPPTGPPQFEQGPSKGGLGPLEDEQAAARVARAAARPAPRPAMRREEARKPMAIDFLGLWSWRLSSGDASA